MHEPQRPKYWVRGNRNAVWDGPHNYFFHEWTKRRAPKPSSSTFQKTSRTRNATIIFWRSKWGREDFCRVTDCVPISKNSEPNVEVWNQIDLVSCGTGTKSQRRVKESWTWASSNDGFSQKRRSWPNPVSIRKKDNRRWDTGRLGLYHSRSSLCLYWS